MAKVTVHVGFGDEDRSYERFIEMWHRAERGEAIEPEVHLTYPDFETLFRVLTPRRMELLRALRQRGPSSVRALATGLERDYKNVHGDVAALEEEGLILRTEEGLIEAPWDGIDAHYSLVA